MLERFVTQLSRTLVGITGISIIVMMVLVVSDVLSRAVLNIAIPGIDTIVAAYLMVATIFLPLAMLQVLDENIAVDIVRDNVPDVLKDIFDLIAQALSCGFYGLLAWIYYDVALEAIQIREFVTGTWDVPIWPARIIMPLGLAIAALAAVVKFFLALRTLFTGTKPSTHHMSEPF